LIYLEERPIEGTIKLEQIREEGESGKLLKTPGSKNLGNIDNLPQEANKNLKEIKFLFGGLNSAVTNMENKFDSALERHEKDFLLAYRVRICLIYCCYRNIC
jgi:hypothetical protein